MDRRESLIESNLGLVHMVARKFLGRGCEYEDLVQIGTIGLIKAVDRFDETKNVCLSTYAVPLIMGEIRQFLRDDGMIKVSRLVKENGRRIKLAKENLAKSLGREPTTSEISDFTGLSVEQIAEAIDSICDVASLEDIRKNEDIGFSYMDRAVSGGARMQGVGVLSADGENTNNESDKVVNKIFLNEIIKNLDEQEFEVIYLRYFMEKTQSEVGKILGISQVGAYRLEKKVLQHLRILALT